MYLSILCELRMPQDRTNFGIISESESIMTTKDGYMMPIFDSCIGKRHDSCIYMIWKRFLHYFIAYWWRNASIWYANDSWINECRNTGTHYLLAIFILHFFLENNWQTYKQYNKNNIKEQYPKIQTFVSLSYLLLLLFISIYYIYLYFFSLFLFTVLHRKHRIRKLK